MRALLKPVIVRELGVVLLKPGSELLNLFSAGRVLVEPQPTSMANFATGLLPDAQQPLSRELSLRPFFLHEKVIGAAGGLRSLEHWLLNCSGYFCQNPHSDYHYHEMTTMWHKPGVILLCGHCDNHLREQYTETLAELACQNVIHWILDTIRIALMIDKAREISLAELSWWAVRNGVTEALPEAAARETLHLPEERKIGRESDITPGLSARSILADRVRCIQLPEVINEPLVGLLVDPAPPNSFMRRPKRLRWQCPDYLTWVKTQPCECCQQPSDDPHHLIGWGQGGMGTKAHDIFFNPTLP